MAVVCVAIGLLMTFSNINDISKELDTSLVKPLTDNTTGYTTADGLIPNYNAFDHIIIGNLQYLLYIGAAICVIIGIGKHKGEGNE